MITTAIADVLPVAVVVAISPLAIITSIVVLLSDGGRWKAALFAAGWMLTLLVVTGIALAVTDAVEETDPEATGEGIKVFSLILGVLFLVMAVVSFRRRPAPGEPAKETKVLAKVTGMSGLSVLLLGLIEGVAIIKNIPLSLGAGGRIAVDTEGGASSYVALIVYVVIASIGVLAPILIAVIGGRRLDPALASFRQWLEDNISPITIITLLVVGAYFTGKGLLIWS